MSNSKPYQQFEGLEGEPTIPREATECSLLDFFIGLGLSRFGFSEADRFQQFFV
jgi:hypothetical protein